MFDFHVHTHHSFDSEQTIHQIVTRASQAGIRRICLTDHVDYDYDGKNNHYSYSYEDFFREILEAREKYWPAIELLAGVEFGLQPHLEEKYLEDAMSWPFDYIIGSLHSVKKTDIFAGDYFSCRTQQAAYDDYLDDMLQVIELDIPFSTIGHFDMIKRYGPYTQSLPLINYRDKAAHLFKKLAQEGKGIELNTSGYRYGLNDNHPSRDLLELYLETGGEILVVGSDAHKPEEVGYRFRESLELLQSVGYRYITTFRKREPEFHLIQKILDHRS